MVLGAALIEKTENKCSTYFQRNKVCIIVNPKTQIIKTPKNTIFVEKYKFCIHNLIRNYFITFRFARAMSVETMVLTSIKVILCNKKYLKKSHIIIQNF